MKCLKKILLLLSLFAIVVSCSKKGSNPEDPTIDPPQPTIIEKVVLEASQTEIIADGVDVTKFTVKADGVDVTTKAEIYQGTSTTPMSIKEFKITEPGNYEFYAKYENKSSEKVVIVANKKPEGPEVILKASTNVIKANNKDVCTFTVSYNNEDVTEKAEVFLTGSTEPLNPKEFKTAKTGTHKFYAKYEDKKSREIEIDATPYIFEGELKIEGSNLNIVANGKDVCTFTVTADGEDVTSDSKIYIKNAETPLESNTFSSVEDGGKYEFYAKYKGASTSNIIVNVTESTEVVTTLTLPEDPQPDNYNFDRKVLAVQFTGTKCPNCPSLVAAIKGFKENYKYAADRVVFAAAHAYNNDDPMVSPISSMLKNDQGIRGFPGMTCDFKKKDINSYGSRNAANLNKMVEEHYKSSTAKVGIAAVALESADGIDLKVEIKAKLGGNYGIGAFLLEDGIKATQSGATTQEDNIHNNVIRAYIGNNNDSYGSSNHLTANTKYQFDLKFKVDNTWIKKNCKVVVYVVDLSTGKTVNNTILCKVGKQVSYRYK